MAGIKVCKFGGTSMADGNVIRKVASIIRDDPERRFVVVSAPGKRFSQDIKVTDLLYKCNEEALSCGSCENSFSKIRERFMNIVAELKLEMDICSVLDETQKAIENNKSAEFAASRGEYLSARVFANVLGAEFIDATELIRFDVNGMLSEESYSMTAKRLSGVDLAVIPGFYGLGADGKIKTFSRGGSDITGSIIARGVSATLYENWTDVSGFMACDPRIVNNPKKIEMLSYKELRELSYMGANVLHSESIFPVRRANIPINIRNTFRPEDSGTMILPIKKYRHSGNIVTGIAGKKDFVILFIEKSQMNSEIGFCRKVLSALEDNGVSFEHMPSGIDTMSIVLDSHQVAHGVLDSIIEEITESVKPDLIKIYNNIALIATVGHGMSSNIGTSARLFGALAKANVNVKVIDQGSSELNIIVGVDNADCDKCISAIYNEFFN